MPEPSRARLILLLALASGCRLGPKDPVLLSLGDQTVTKSDFDRHLKALETRGGAPLDPTVRTALLEPFLEERVLVLEARASGLLAAKASPEDEQRAVQKLLESAVLAGLSVAETEVAAYFDAHRDEFRVPERVALRQILLATAVEAREVLRRLRRDAKSFDSLARTRSRAPEAGSGGAMGSFARGELPSELEAAAFALPAGGVSDVVATSLGFHILKLNAREPARERPLEECRDEIRARLTRQKSDQSVRQFVLGLMARAKVNHEVAQAAAVSS